MKKTGLLVFLFIATVSFAQEKFQLAQPMLKFSSVFFSGSAVLEVIFDQPGAEVHFTVNGKEPSESDLLYTEFYAGAKPDIPAGIPGRETTAGCL